MQYSLIHQRSSKIPKSECPDIWIRLPKHKWPKSWSNMEDPVCSRKESVRSPFDRIIVGKDNSRNSVRTRLGKSSQNWECLHINRERGLFLSLYVDDIELTSKTENIAPIWKILKEDVDFAESTSFLDHVCLGCTQRECKIRNDIVTSNRDVFEFRISAGVKEKILTRASGKIDAEIKSFWFCDMEELAKKCVERCCEFANKTTQFCRVETRCMDDHQFEEENESVGDLSFCSQIVLKCLNFARVGRHDFSWSVNKLVRSVTKWTKSLW